HAALVDVGDDPDAVQVADGEERLAGGDVRAGQRRLADHCTGDGGADVDGEAARADRLGGDAAGGLCRGQAGAQRRDDIACRDDVADVDRELAEAPADVRLRVHHRRRDLRVL